MAKIQADEIVDLGATYRDQQPRQWIRVGMSTCGLAAGAGPVHETLTQEVARRGLNIPVLPTGCNGMCYAEPLVEIHTADMPPVMYGGIDSAAAIRLLDEHIGQQQVVTELQVPGTADLGYDDSENDSLQQRIVLRNCGRIDPTSIEDYIARGGYHALARALTELGPDGVIAELKAAGLRGRGGAGFPTWMKWQFCQQVEADTKYMICNADEGDPGAYMDRSVLEGDPHSVVEGMIIGGLVTGASVGYFYIRAEYPLAIERVDQAIRQARRHGLLGKKILGTDFEYKLQIRLGAGAFVCGEETALMQSIEGRRGTPKPRPPFPAESGLWGKPSNINNVETLANIAPIVQRGGDWFGAIGVGRSTGTKVFAMTGKIERPGLIEIPMGTNLGQVVEEIGGGVAPGRTLKGVQTGGPSGGVVVIPGGNLDIPVSYEGLAELGSIMGSGGLIVIDDQDSMLDMTRFYLGFCVEESCGKCAPCRVGGTQMLRLLDQVADGKATEEDFERIRRIALAMKKASLCGLGQTAPNPVLSALRYFKDEFTVAPTAESTVSKA